MVECSRKPTYLKCRSLPTYVIAKKNDMGFGFTLCGQWVMNIVFFELSLFFWETEYFGRIIPGPKLETLDEKFLWNSHKNGQKIKKNCCSQLASCNSVGKYIAKKGTIYLRLESSINNAHEQAYFLLDKTNLAADAQALFY